MKKGTVLVTAIICAIGFPVVLWFTFYGTVLADHPSLYFNQKIFYFHVPTAFIMFASVFTCGIYSILFLKKRKPEHDDIANASAELGVVFGAIVLITGMTWGKASWDVWWQWEARLTTALLLWMIMLAYVLVRKYGGPGAERLGAGLGVFAMLDVPLIYISVHIWRTVHPKTSVVPGLQGKMKIAFWLGVLTFIAFYILLLKARVAMIRTQRGIDEVRERALDTGLID